MNKKDTPRPDTDDARAVPTSPAANVNALATSAKKTLFAEGLIEIGKRDREGLVKLADR